MVQKWVRSYFVRLAIRRHNAALALQRHVMGMLVRKRLLNRHRAAREIQARLRGAQARQRARQQVEERARAVTVLQRGVRMWKGKMEAKRRHEEKRAQDARLEAACLIQRVFRGRRGRRRFNEHKARHMGMLREVRAAMRIQSAVRRFQASVRVGAMRRIRLVEMNKAATAIRKYYLRWLYRRRFLELRQEFLTHLDSIVTIQRYVRGYVVRLRMWRNAIRAEEELWAAVEIQRCWRGYRGRVRWELEYEAVRSREEAVFRLQRFIRGWLGRTRVHRLRKRIARSEFEKARRRFKAAQRIQAMVRGCQARERVAAMRARKVGAALTIQRIWRGRRLRRMLWSQLMYKRTVQIQALARGFLVRNRRYRLIAQVINIQRHYRHWLHAVPVAERRRRVYEWQRRRREARAQEIAELPHD
mmetsp:Transcript_31265/g.93085  ORF Transcript_31265/g.93085 Transcript_31265/m.93085 type:complete len:416 (-) Transcript_31265:115-1362(-)